MTPTSSEDLLQGFRSIAEAVTGSLAYLGPEIVLTITCCALIS